LLPRLWQYTLLRCSLTSRADTYPLTAFRLLVLLKRKQEALGLAELLTDPAKKMQALLQIAKQLREQSDQGKEWLALLLRAGEIARTIEKSYPRAEALRELGTALAQAQQWERAEAVIGTIEHSDLRAEALAALGTALAQAQQWERAHAVIGTIEHSDRRAGALAELAAEMAEAGEDEMLLHLIQRWWRLSDNREDALKLFPLVTRFIPHHPELGFALHEAFTWVDAFLKR
jgi:tetratricopeptide (TPR) repeat protein